MQTLKMAPLRAMFLAGVVLLSHATCISAEVSQHHAELSIGTDKAPMDCPSCEPPPEYRPCEAGTFDWAQCRSEGGSKDCASCKGGDGNGVLPCDKQTVGTHRFKVSNCPDNKLWKGSMFVVSGRGEGLCSELNDFRGLRGYAMTTYAFPGGICNSSAPELLRNLVATKIFITHPHRASLNVGVVIAKRLVMHRCTGTNPAFCKKGDKVADVFKQGFCVQCKSKKYIQTQKKGKKVPEQCKSKEYIHDCGNNCTVFHSWKGADQTDKEKKAFLTECTTEAFTSEGILKDDYRCSDKDLMLASATIATF